MSSNLRLRARIRFLSTDEGGRATPLAGGGSYWPNHDLGVGNGEFRAGAVLLPVGEVCPGDTIEAEVMLQIDPSQTAIVPGCEWTLYEGPRAVAAATALEILSQAGRMSEPPTWLLETLASKAEQVRFMIGGSKDEFLDPNDLLNDAWHFCERAKKPEAWNGLSEDQQQKTAYLEVALGQHGHCLEGYNRSTIGTLVEADLNWQLLRQAAADTLRAFGIAAPN
ncbi:hypothetical protein BH11PSE1_BH11PSE1_16710 [soil metagenome]